MVMALAPGPVLLHAAWPRRRSACPVSRPAAGCRHPRRGGCPRPPSAHRTRLRPGCARRGTALVDAHGSAVSGDGIGDGRRGLRRKPARQQRWCRPRHGSLRWLPPPGPAPTAPARPSQGHGPCTHIERVALAGAAACPQQHRLGTEAVQGGHTDAQYPFGRSLADDDLPRHELGTAAAASRRAGCSGQGDVALKAGR